MRPKPKDPGSWGVPPQGMQQRRSHDTPDARLVDAALAGDRRAFDALVLRYRARIFALSLHITGSASDADDVTQDVFVKAYASLDRFRGQSRFFTWLYRIALNRALNHRRDSRRRAGPSLDDDRVRAAVAVDAGGDPRLALELADRYAHLVEALDALSPALRATVVLVALQGLSHRETALVLGSTEGTVGWRMHEARRQLRATLERLQREPTPRPRMRAHEGLSRLLAYATVVPERR